MSRRFLLPCPQCENQIELSPVQAGQELTCEKCQHQFAAPKLGAVKKLKPVGNTARDEKKSPDSALKRGLFAGGLSLAVILGLIGTALFLYASSMIFDLQIEKQSEAWNAQIDQLSPSQALDEWNHLSIDEGLGEWSEQAVARYRTQGQILQKIAFGLWGLAGLGLLTMLASFFVRRP